MKRRGFLKTLLSAGGALTGLVACDPTLPDTRTITKAMWEPIGPELRPAIVASPQAVKYFSALLAEEVERGKRSRERWDRLLKGFKR